jgi:AcrR family transcriptional regulator
MPRPGRHVEGAKTRERVLTAAADLIARQGYAATSITQISERSGANPASIYWAFGSKEGLLAAVMERSAAAFFAHLEPPREADAFAWLATLAGSFAGGPEFLRLLLVLSLERRDGDPVVLEAARRVRSAAADGLSSAYAAAFAIDDRFRRRAVCDRLARFTLMLLDGVFVASQIEADTTDLRRAFEMIAIAVEATGRQLLAQTPRVVRGRPAAAKARKGVRR